MSFIVDLFDNNNNIDKLSCENIDKIKKNKLKIEKVADFLKK